MKPDPGMSPSTLAIQTDADDDRTAAMIQRARIGHLPVAS